jgi:hypothetical protein
MFIDWGFSMIEAIDATISNVCQLDLDVQTLNEEVKNLLNV